MSELNEKPILYYDGECGLCSWAVRVLSSVDTRDIFEVESLQGRLGQGVLKSMGLPTTGFDTMIVQSGDQFYTKSDAVLKVLDLLGAPWSAAILFKIVPRSLRDWLYMRVSRNRLKFFGTNSNCPLPTPPLRRKLERSAARSTPVPSEPQRPL